MFQNVLSNLIITNVKYKCYATNVVFQKFFFGLLTFIKAIKAKNLLNKCSMTE